MVFGVCAQGVVVRHASCIVLSPVRNSVSKARGGSGASVILNNNGTSAVLFAQYVSETEKGRGG